MSAYTIYLICIIILSVSLIFVSFWCDKLRKHIKELKGTIADEKYIRQTVINQQQKKIKTFSFRYNKPLDYVTGNPRLNLNLEIIKQDMIKEIVKQMIEDNIFQIKEFDFYYEGKLFYIKPDSFLNQELTKGRTL